MSHIGEIVVMLDVVHSWVALGAVHVVLQGPAGVTINSFAVDDLWGKPVL
jgi:hypothetical protein